MDFKEGATTLEYNDLFRVNDFIKNNKDYGDSGGSQML